MMLRGKRASKELQLKRSAQMKLSCRLEFSGGGGVADAMEFSSGGGVGVADKGSEVMVACLAAFCFCV